MIHAASRIARPDKGATSGLFRLIFGGPPPAPDGGVAADPTTVLGQFTLRVSRLIPARREIALPACWSLMYGYACLLMAGRIRQDGGSPEAVPEQLGELSAGWMDGWRKRDMRY
jgi:hypothetical protein